MNPTTASRCVLEPQRAAHAVEMYRVLSDPALYEFEHEPPASEEALRDRFRRLESRCSADGRQRWLNWVLRVADGRLVGYVQATVPGDGTAFIAYVVCSSHWRVGIASSAVEAMLAELRVEYGVARAIAVLKAGNFRSMGLLQRLGFRRMPPAQEARHRDGEDEVACEKMLAPRPGGDE